MNGKFQYGSVKPRPPKKMPRTEGLMEGCIVSATEQCRYNPRIILGGPVKPRPEGNMCRFFYKNRDVDIIQP